MQNKMCRQCCLTCSKGSILKSTIVGLIYCEQNEANREYEDDCGEWSVRDGIN
ncbi:MAG: hypothetical protein KAS32_12160 [Candidatus Peribacteraceae bacterium]|nr:hypothetical protein [Candidatus Peribacteraceae bacterium]